MDVKTNFNFKCNICVVESDVSSKDFEEGMERFSDKELVRHALEEEIKDALGGEVKISDLDYNIEITKE